MNSSLYFTFASCVVCISLAFMSYGYFIFSKTNKTYFTFMYVYSSIIIVIAMIFYGLAAQVNQINQLNLIPNTSNCNAIMLICLIIGTVITLLIGSDYFGFKFITLKNPIWKYISG